MEVQHVLGYHDYDEATLVKLHFKFRPVSSKGFRFFGLRYLTKSFDTANSSLIDQTKQGNIKQKGLYVVAKIQVCLDGGYSMCFKPVADQIIQAIPPKYLQSESGVVAYSVRFGNFDSYVGEYENPALVTLYGLKKGHDKKEIEKMPILRNGKNITMPFEAE